VLRNLVNSVLSPSPLRSCAKAIIRSLRLGSLEERARIGALVRPGYGYCTYFAADLAKRLGRKRITVVELGVAGGRGLLQLEQHAIEVEKALSIKIDVVGFDTGEGLPRPVDYRDLPYIWQPGFFKIEADVLRKRLSRAELVFGDIAQTLPTFLSAQDDCSVGAIMVDVDYYSSTMATFTAIERNVEKLLPRSFFYFDDVVGDHQHLYSEFTGELGAINDFNKTHEDLKFSAPPHLFHKAAFEPWASQIYVLHAFEHPLYGEFAGHTQPQLPLR